MTNFNKSKLDELKVDFSIVHLSLPAVKILYDVSSYGASLLEVDEELIRLSFLKSLVNAQSELSQFQYQLEDLHPNLRMGFSMSVFENFRKILKDLTADNEFHDQINKIVDNIFHYFSEKYGTR